MDKKNSLGEMLQESMGKVREMVDANTIVGQPIHTDDGVTLIPISKVSFGRLGGGLGAAVKIVPVAFLIVKDGAVRVMPVAIPASTGLERVVEMVPDLIDKVSVMLKKDGGAAESAVPPEAEDF